LRERAHRERLGDVLAVDGVELLRLRGGVAQEHADADRVLQREACGVGRGFEVVERQARLKGERLVAVAHVVAVARRLAGQEHEAAGFHGGAVRARGQGAAVTGEGFAGLAHVVRYLSINVAMRSAACTAASWFCEKFRRMLSVRSGLNSVPGVTVTP